MPELKHFGMMIVDVKEAAHDHHVHYDHFILPLPIETAFESDIGRSDGFGADVGCDLSASGLIFEEYAQSRNI